MIARAEALAATALDPRVQREANFIAADAYRDIVGLAFGASDGEVDSSLYLPRAKAARTRAITHYAAALKADTTSWMAVEALVDYHRLKQGEQPSGLRLFCRGD
ncbi:MAG TPA: hypothetical protein VNH63_08935 [Gemmatimonadales bacterium]|nr:hypothetical protein [Gemmatimonadales bacterium]